MKKKRNTKLPPFPELNPELLEEWNYEKNENKDPHSLSAGSCEKVWWKCDKGHSWSESITSMTNSKRVKYCKLCHDSN